MSRSEFFIVMKHQWEKRDLDRYLRLCDRPFLLEIGDPKKPDSRRHVVLDLADIRAACRSLLSLDDPRREIERAITVLLVTWTVPGRWPASEWGGDWPPDLYRDIVVSMFIGMGDGQAPSPRDGLLNTLSVQVWLPEEFWQNVATD